MNKLISFTHATILFLSLSSSDLYGNEDAKKAVSGSEILGEWWSPEKDARIQITEKDQKYFGHLSWIKPEDKDKFDDKNPDPTLRTTPLQGLVILKNFTFEDGRWTAGTIYDPKNGKTYSCKMSLEKSDHDQLNIRGYIGISLFGRSETFTRYKGQ